MSSIEIKKISITELSSDAIVNAANEGLWAGGGVCGAIFRAAGHASLSEACRKIGHCATGSAVITPGFDLKAKYIIHAVGPVWRGGKNGESSALSGAYRRSLELALDNGCASIAFPLISSGIFGYPVEEAWKTAILTCRDFLAAGHKIDIVFAVIDDSFLAEGISALRRFAPEYAVACRGDWKSFAMPALHDTFILEQEFTPEQMKALRRGNIPRGMEDKWFWYMEGSTLWAHRSWTGYCIFRIDFREDDHHVVTVNRDPEQYKSAGVEEDIDSLNRLLDWWIRTPYDHYNEWLSETYDTLKKAGRRE
jgi:O-acetyl-ADP-ribose deacetylase (regulator of RNase III)